MYAQDDAVGVHPCADRDVGIRRSVLQRITDEVARDLGQPRFVAEDGRGTIRVDDETAFRMQHASVRDHLCGDGGEIDRRVLEGPAGVGPREQGQLVRQQPHSPQLSLHARHRFCEGIGVGQTTTQVELDPAARCGQRRTQLVRGICDERAHAVFGILLHIEGEVHGARHARDCRVTAALDRKTEGAVALCDPLGVLSHRREWAKTTTDDDRRRNDEDDGRHHRRHRERRDQENAIGLAIGCAHHEHGGGHRDFALVVAERQRETRRVDRFGEVPTVDIGWLVSGASHNRRDIGFGDSRGREHALAVEKNDAERARCDALHVLVGDDGAACRVQPRGHPLGRALG